MAATRLGAALALAACLTASGAAALAAAPERSCTGRYVLVRASGTLLDATSAVIDPACGAATVTAHTIRHGTRIAARWTSCRGARALRLRLRASADCTLLKGTVAGRGRQSRVVAVTSTCGDGVVDPGRGERCDDGNLLDGDGCDSSCGACSGPTDFATTWDAIQTNVFDRACTTCHGASASGGLDFRAPGTYQRIVGTTAPDDPALLLVRPGDRATSFLWLKIDKGTAGGHDGVFGEGAFGLRLKIEKGTAGGHDEVSGPGMPIGPSLPADVVDAIGRWIDAGAAETGLVAGTDALTRACP